MHQRGWMFNKSLIKENTAAPNIFSGSSNDREVGAPPRLKLLSSFLTSFQSSFHSALKIDSLCSVNGQIIAVLPCYLNGFFDLRG